MLGISIYPDKTNYKDNKAYIDLCAKYGYNQLFTCLLSVDKPKEEIKAEYLQMITYAKKRGFEVTLDVSPRVFDQLNISYSDLSFFKELNADAIRLDESYNGKTEAQMTYNPQNLKIEINMSQDTPYIDNILAYYPRKDKLIGCHNFYPSTYAGLTLEFFKACTERYKRAGIRTKAFVTSPSSNIGPWPVMEGLPSLEMHRYLPIDVQAKHLYALGIDDILISNQFASEEEIAKLAAIDRYIQSFTLITNNNSAIENTILFNEEHFYRGDVSPNLIRSTQSRVKYKQENFPKRKTSDILHKGTVIIGNNDYGQYKGEVQVILDEVKDENLARNIVGYIPEEEHILLDLLQPWQRFTFTEEMK